MVWGVVTGVSRVVYSRTNRKRRILRDRIHQVSSPCSRQRRPRPAVRLILTRQLFQSRQKYSLGIRVPVSLTD